MKTDSDLFLTQTFKFTTQAATIHCFSLADDHSIVLIREKMWTWQPEFVHMAVGGQILWLYPLDRQIKSFQMIGTKHVLINTTQVGEVLLLQLQKRQARRISIFKKSFYYKEQLQNMYFSESGLILCIEKAQSRLLSNLLYYNLDQIVENRDPVCRKTVDKGNGGLYRRHIIKMDNFSKVCWINPQSIQRGYQVCIFNLFDNPNKSIEIIKIHCQPTLLLNDVACSISQSKIVLFNSTKKRHRSGQIYLFKELVSIDISFQESELQSQESIYSMNERQSKIELLELTLHQQDYQLSNDNKKKLFNLGNIIVLVQSSTILFINTITYEIQCIKNIEDKNAAFMVPSWDNSVLIHYSIKKYELIMYCTHVGLPPLNYVYLHLLTNIQDEFDDDLLQDVIQLLLKEEEE